MLTSRLRLRLLEPRDAERLSAYRSDPNVARYQSWTIPFSVAAALELIQSMQSRDITDLGWTQIALANLETDELIGDIGFNRVDSSNAEIGFTLASDWQARGIMREALETLLEHTAQTGIRRVTATTDVRNLASQRLLTRLGFTLEQILKDSWLEDSQYYDEYLYALKLVETAYGA
jgi:RimJ/RimL family protein N-acetyltransferase